MISHVGVPSARLERRVIADFGAEASAAILAALALVPEGLPLADKQDAERLQAALVLPAHGSAAEFERRLRLAQADWRDALVGAGLGDADWAERLEIQLGPSK